MRSQHPQHPRPVRIATAGLGLATALLLSACGGGSPGADPSGSTPVAGEGTTTAASPSDSGSPSPSGSRASTDSGTLTIPAWAQAEPDGEAAPDLAEVWPDALSALEDAQSLSIDSTVHSTGAGRIHEPTETGQRVQISGFVDDSFYEGTFSEGAGTIEFLGDGQTEYAQPDEASLLEDGPDGEDLQGKWLVGMAMVPMFTMSAQHQMVLFSVSGLDEAADGFTGALSELDGQEVYHYVGTPDAAQGPVHLFISPEHRLVQLKTPSVEIPGSPVDGPTHSPGERLTPVGSSSGEQLYDTWTLSDWNEVTVSPMPEESEVVVLPGQ